MNFNLEILGAVVWLLVAGYGFGSLTIRLLRPRILIGVGFSVLVGTAIFVVLGGWLALFGGFRSEFVTGWLWSGSFLAVWTAYAKFSQDILVGRRKVRDWLALTPSGVGIAAAVFVFVRNSGYGWINGHDDMEAYIAFAEKLNQTGSLGADPFSFRRLVSSLGGQTILDGAFLTVGPAYGLKAVDMSLGFAAFIMVVAYWSIKSWPRRIGSSLFVIVASFYWLPMANTTSHYLSMAIILSLTLFITEYDLNWSWRDWVVVALLYGVGLTLKTTTATFLLLLLPILLFLILRSNGSGFLRRSFLFLSITITIVSPFAASLFISSGTFFYPFLGGGFEATPVTHDFIDTAEPWALLVEFSKVPFRRPEFLLALVVTVVSFASLRGAKEGRLLAIQVLAGITIFAPYLATSGSFDATRYASTLFLPLLLASLIRLHGSLALKTTVSIATIAAISLMSSSIYLSLNPRLPFQLTLEPTPSWLSEKEYFTEKDRVEQIQDRLPVGATVLVNGPSAYLWNYTRNEILLFDIPGSASPPPGINLWGGTSEISEYLVGSGVDFAIADYRGHFEFETYEHMLDESYPPQWRRQIINQFRLYEVILEFKADCGEILDDGKSLVISTDCAPGGHD